jgi:hypothetical protein
MTRYSHDEGWQPDHGNGNRESSTFAALARLKMKPLASALGVCRTETPAQLSHYPPSMADNWSGFEQ